MAAAALQGQRQARIEESASLERFELPERHPAFESSTPGRAFVTVMEGCDMFCTFCIVPTTRGREISRPADAIVDEVERLAARGVVEVTLLGQTVNAYGRHDVRRAEARRARGATATVPVEPAETVAYADLLRRIDAVPGIDRIRYTSPHPIFFDDALIRAHGELEHLCPHVHLPLQSGSDAVLARMRRRYGRGEFLAIVRALREARPDIAISTDLIVGFPGETDRDFEQTLDVMRASAFVDSYSFKYSPRPGTAAAGMEDAVPPAVAQERLERLQDLQRELTLEAHRARVGEDAAVLVEGASRRGGRQRSGRDPWHRVVNFEVGDADRAPAGSLQTVRVLEATPHSLVGVLAGDEDAEDVRNSVKTGGGSADEWIRIGGGPS
jgi:tRNA-2-methylthio-N6-dimethylallyladenosine synthase